MAILQFANEAQTTLASSLSPTTTTLTVASGAGGLFPTLTTNQSFYFTISNGIGGGSNADEICLCTVHAAASDTFATIVRGQDGTSAETWTAGANIQMLCNAGTQRSFLQRDQAQVAPPIYGIAGGTVNAPTLTVASGLTTLTDGMTVVFESTGANTGSMTFDLTLGTTNTGAIAIVTAQDLNVPAASIPRAGIPVWLTFSGALSSWILVSPQPVASTTVNGLIGLAATGDLLSSISQKALTPSVMIASSSPVVGYGEIGFWEHWLIETAQAISVSANSSVTVTFPVAFATGVGYINYSCTNQDSIGDAMQVVTAKSTTQMTIWNTTSLTQNLTWLAMGN